MPVGSSDSSKKRRVGPYTVEREIGRGSYGMVYLGRRPDRPEPVAIKMFLAPGDGVGMERFGREIALARRLRHPGIVAAIESGWGGPYPWVAMEYVPGPTLHARLHGGALPPEEVRRMAIALAEALAYAHREGVVHRDLKPANIILGEPTGAPRITDFGLAQDQTAQWSLTRTGIAIGTPQYMAPEQLVDSKRVDRRIDIYALGVIVYECLAGRRPYDGEAFLQIAEAVQLGRPDPLARAAPGAPDDLVATCERAMHVDIEKRFATAEEMAEALRARAGAARGRTGRARRSSRLAVGTASRRPPAIALLGLGAGGLALLAGLVAFALGGDAEGVGDAADAEEPAPPPAAVEPSPAELRLAEIEHAEDQLSSGDASPARALLERPAEPDATTAELDARGRLELRLTLHDAVRLAPGDDRIERAREVVERLERIPPAGGAPAGIVESLEHERGRIARLLLESARESSVRRAPFDETIERLDLARRAAPTGAARAEIALERADYLFRRGRFEQAAEEARALAGEPGRTGLQARYLAAFSLIWLERYDAGVGELKTIWESDRDGVVGQNAGAAFHSFTGRNDIGARLAEAALALDPDDVDTYISLAFCRNDLSNAHRDDAARRADCLRGSLEASGEAIRRQPDHPRAYMARAFALGNLGRTDDAIAAYDEVIRLTEPRPHVRALRFRARHRLARNDAQGAYHDFQRAIELNAQDAEALLWRGVIRAQRGDQMGAQEDWVSAARAGQQALNRGLGTIPQPARDQIAGFLRQRFGGGGGGGGGR